MSDFKNLHPVQLSIEKPSRLLLVKQGDNVVKLTRNDVIKLDKLHKGELKDIGGKTLNVFTSQLIPRNRFTVAENGYIVITCKDEFESNVVVIAIHKKLDDLQRILDFVEKNNTKIAWSKEFRGRY